MNTVFKTGDMSLLIKIFKQTATRFKLVYCSFYHPKTFAFCGVSTLFVLNKGISEATNDSGFNIPLEAMRCYENDAYRLKIVPTLHTSFYRQLLMFNH